MKIKDGIVKVKYYLKRYGVIRTSKKIVKRLLGIKPNRMVDKEVYNSWIAKNEIQEEIEKQKDITFEKMPLISIVVPMYNTPEKYLKELIDSVKSQTYTNWELCLADGSEEQNNEFKKYIDDARIKYIFLNKNSGISGNTNEAIKMATGEYISFLDHDDILAKNCLFEIVKEINESDSDFIYTDEDKINEDGERFEPYFKPDFSPEAIECNNYITHFVVVKKSIQEKVGFLKEEFNGAQDFDFVLRCTDATKKISHISKVLYHWRVNVGSTADVADAKPYAFNNGVKVIDSHIERIGKKGHAENPGEVPGIYRIKYDVINNPKVSIIIPNKDNKALLKTCIESIINNTTYDNYEVLVVENNTTDKRTLDYYEQLKQNDKIKIVDFSKENPDIKEFNYSKLINYGVSKASGDFICQLNNDTKIISKDWLETFMGYAQDKEIGAVGARLYYEDKTIQHAGIIVGLSGIAGNALVNLAYGAHCNFGKEAATRNVLAVTGACLFCRKELYEEVGFMDEGDFKVAFNDVDFCLKLVDKGYRNVYIPFVELFHYESKTRGYEITEEQEARFKKESKAFNTKWKKYVDYDPYYNRNFTRKTCNYDIEG